MTATMTSAQTIKTRINDLLDAGGGSSSAEIGSIAAAYARLSADTNARLRTCLELLRRGLRSEAIQHAEAEPELFGLIQSLDLRRLQEWDQVCVERGLERPRPVLIEAVKALNDAIAEEHRLQPLLRRHRDLALRRAPIRERLATLRALAEHDSHNPVWTSDVRVFEAARLREIESLFASANPPQDLQTCNALLNELVDGRWLERPRPIVVQAARALLAAAQRRWAETECRALLPRMHEAQDAWDVPAAERLRARWEEVLRAAGNPGPADLPQDLREAWEPIGAWYAAHDRRRAQEEQFAALAEALRDAVRAGGPLDRLEAIHDQLRAFNRPIDEALQRDYEAIVAELRLAKRRRQRAKLAVLAASMVVVLVVLAVATHDLFARRAAESGSREALAALAQGDLTTARDTRIALAGWQPFILGRDMWSAALERTDEALSAADAQAAAFAAAMERIEARSPANITADLLREAEALALGAADRQRLEEARRAVDRYQAEQQARRDERMLGQIAEASERLDALAPQDIAAHPRGLAAALSPIEHTLGSIRSEGSKRVGVMAALAPVEARAAALRATVDRALAALERREAEARALAELPRQGHSASSLAEALERFVAQFPDAAAARDFARAAEQVEAWRAIDAWTALTADWASPRPANVVQASGRLEAIRTGADAYLRRHPQSPLRDEVERYAEYLASIVLSASPRSSWQVRVRDLTEAPVMTQLEMVEAADGRRFYTTRDATIRQTVIGTHIELALTPDLTRLTEETFDPGVLQLPPTPSPQRALARQVRQMLETLDVSEAAVGPVRVIDHMAQAERVDPILRAILVTRTAEEVGTIGEAMRDELDAWLAPLRGIELIQVNWMNGYDDSVAELRAAVAEALEAMGPMEPVAETVRQWNAEALAGVDRRIVSRGVVMRREGNVSVEPVTAFTSGDARLFAAVPGPGEQDWQLQQIGVLRNGEAALERGAAATLPAGSLVYVAR